MVGVLNEVCRIPGAALELVDPIRQDGLLSGQRPSARFIEIRQQLVASRCEGVYGYGVGLAEIEANSGLQLPFSRVELTDFHLSHSGYYPMSHNGLRLAYASGNQHIQIRTPSEEDCLSNYK